MPHLIDFLNEALWHAGNSSYTSISTGNFKPISTKTLPVSTSGLTVTGGHKVDVDIDKLAGKDEKKNKGIWAVDAPTDDDVMKTDGEPTSRNMNQIASKIAANEPFFVLGHAGWGKTSIIKKVAKRYGKTVITVYLDKIPPEDLGGIPVPVKDEETGKHYQEILLPSWAQYMYDHPDEDFLLFFDEMNQATPEVMNTLMPIILENVICGYKFDNFMCGGAGNYLDENDCVHDLPSPIVSRVAPIIIWGDDDEDSWEEAMDFLKRKWGGKIDGKADEILKVCDKYKTFFKNPREMDTKIFGWLDSIISNAQRTGRPLDKGVFDMHLIEDRVCTLFVHEKDVYNLANYKKEVMANASKKRAVIAISEAIYNALFTITKNNNDDDADTRKSTLSNTQIDKFVSIARRGNIMWPTKNPKDTLIVSKDNICELFDLVKQQQKQIDVVMGDTDGPQGYAWQTEAEAKKANPKWLTYEEACKKYKELN
jgi:MoxR-like ATPase